MTLRPSPICRLEACRRDEAESRVAATSNGMRCSLALLPRHAENFHHLVLGRPVGGKYGNAIVAAS